MNARTLVAVVTALLCVSSFAGLLPFADHRASAPSASPSETATIAPTAVLLSYGVFDGLDFPSLVFFPGQSVAGTMYFSVTDIFDAQVNVTLTDPNATRDGVPTPAFHYVATMNTSTFSFNSYTAGVSYTFPAGLPYGGHWLLNISGAIAGTAYQNLTVRVFDVSLSSSVGTSATLPGEAITLFWSLYSQSNDATLYTHATNVTLTGRYTGNGTPQAFFAHNVALTPASAGYGEWTGAVPWNATPGSAIHLEVYAFVNLSGQIVENESSNLTVGVGTLSLRGVGLTAAPPTCSLVNSVNFANGSLVAGCLLAGAVYHAAFTPIAGLPVTITFWNGTAHVGSALALATNASGEAAFTFVASTPPFIPQTQYPRYNAVNFTVRLPNASALYTWQLWSNLSWAITGGSSADATVSVALGHTNYYVGQTATANWSVRSSNLTKTGPITPIGWTVNGPNAITYAEGTLNGTSSNGTFTFPVVPAMALQTIDVFVYAANATQTFSAETMATVLQPSLLLSPSSSYYGAGASISVTAVLNGGAPNATIQYQVMGTWASGSAVLVSGSVTSGGTIPVQVPPTTPPGSIGVNAWAIGAGNQVVATASVTLYLAQGYSLLLGVTTVSSYADGSYQPGQTVTLSYQLVSVGGAALPQVLTFTLFAIGYPSVQQIQNVGPSGTLPYTIPSNAVHGTLFIELEVQAGSPHITCLPMGSCYAIASMPINANPSALDLEIGAGSGVTVGWLILLVLVVLTAVAFVWLWRRHGRRPSSVGPPAAEWKEPPPPTSSGSPPDAPGSPPSSGGS